MIKRSADLFVRCAWTGEPDGEALAAAAELEKALGFPLVEPGGAGLTEQGAACRAAWALLDPAAGGAPREALARRAEEVEDFQSQQGMEDYFRGVEELLGVTLAGTINQWMAPRLVSCSAGERWVLWTFDAPDFAVNPGGVMHGGMIATAFDAAMGSIASYCNSGAMTPTIQLSVSYLRPIQLGRPFFIRARVNASGRTMGYLEARAWQEEEDAPAATAVGLYHHPGRAGH